MGRAKDWELEQEERGWWSVPGKYVCSECFEEQFLKQFVRDHAEASKCDFCETTAEELTGEEGNLIAAPFDAVMQVIAEGLQSEWSDADSENIPYESAEGGYQADTQDTYDLVWNYVSPGNDEVAQQIIDALPDHAWVERGYWSLNKNQALWYGWENFCELVKHKNRYMFHLRPTRVQPEAAVHNVGESAMTAETQQTEQTIERAQKQDLQTNSPPETNAKAENAPLEIQETASTADAPTSPLGLLSSFAQFAPEPINSRDIEEAIEEAQEGVSASRMLDEIGDAVEEVGLVRELPAGTKLFRGRVGPSRRPYSSARKLGPPPERRTVANRMSPAGIPMFYGAFEEYTAVAETILSGLKKKEVVNVGAFEALENIHVLDLTNIPSVPSLFSPTRYLRPILIFLHSFVDDLSKPIKKDERVHTEYVPTQIVTEYFRYSFHREGGPPIRGILYPSSRAKGGISCVLFFTREECGAIPVEKLMRKKQWLRFVPRSHKIFRRKSRKPKHARNSSPPASPVVQ
jgi:HEPN/RES N-terminal domain 1/RES domain